MTLCETVLGVRDTVATKKDEFLILLVIETVCLTVVCVCGGEEECPVIIAFL